AAGLLGEAEYLGQAEPRAFAYFLGGEERLEGLAQYFLTHTSAGVGYRQHHVFTGRWVLGAQGRLVNNVIAVAHCQLAAVTHGITGVDRLVMDVHIDPRRVLMRMHAYGRH